MPAIEGTKSTQSVTDETTIAPFAADNHLRSRPRRQIETITITLTASGLCVRRQRHAVVRGAGLTWTGPGTYALATGSPARGDIAELDLLVFTPTVHQAIPGLTVITAMSISVTDGIAVTPTVDAATTIVATAVNDPPRIMGAEPGQAVTDETTITPFTGVSVADVDTGQTETVTVTLSNRLNGSLSDLLPGATTPPPGSTPSPEPTPPFPPRSMPGRLPRPRTRSRQAARRQPPSPSTPPTPPEAPPARAPPPSSRPPSTTLPPSPAPR